MFVVTLRNLLNELLSKDGCSLCNHSKIKMKIEDLRRYYDSLCEKLKNGTPDIVLNDDRAHNSVIERFMLDSSKIVCMYCGEMSVFRRRFYAHIDSSIAENETEKH